MSPALRWSVLVCILAGGAFVVGGSVARDVVIGVVTSLDGSGEEWSTQTHGSGATSLRGRRAVLSTQGCETDCRVAMWSALPATRGSRFLLEVAVTSGSIPDDGFARGLLAGADDGPRLWWGTRQVAPDLWVGRIHQSLDGRSTRIGVVVRGTEASIEVERVRLLAVRPNPVWSWSAGSVVALALALAAWGLHTLSGAAGRRAAAFVLCAGLGAAMALGLPFGAWLASVAAPDPWLAPVRLGPLMAFSHVAMFAAGTAVARRTISGRLADHAAVWLSLAITTEALQGLSSSRSAEWEDIVADLIGVAIGLVLSPAAARTPSPPSG